VKLKNWSVQSLMLPIAGWLSTTGPVANAAASHAYLSISRFKIVNPLAVPISFRLVAFFFGLHCLL
jgi:hypothetical protein